MDISWPQSPVTVIEDVSEPIPLPSNHCRLVQHPLIYITAFSMIILIINLSTYGFSPIQQNFMVGIDPMHFEEAGMLVSLFPFEPRKVNHYTLSLSRSLTCWYIFS